MMQVELMAELQQSMSKIVIIPTAGTGSRMGEFATHINKALLPYKNKPVLAHIIDQFPKDSRFIIPIGHRGDQIVDFCTVAYADRSIEFLEIDDWTSTLSGTGYTLKKCGEIVNEPFWYVPCDTYFDEPLPKITTDCYFVKQVPDDVTELYTMFNVMGTIVDISFKQKQNSNWFAFTGMMHIQNHAEFFHRLNALGSNEFIGAIEKGSEVSALTTWIDFGNPAIYKLALDASQKFDFTKKDEITYICNDKVVKWWMDKSVAKKKYDKFLSNPSVYPENCKYLNNWLVYDYFSGETLYAHNDPSTFSSLLDWLDKKVWIADNKNIHAPASLFYKDKTLSRIKLFREKYPTLPKVNNVNGVKVDESVIDTIDWEYVSTTCLSGKMHGDLQFDNIIVNDEKKFTLIDWRHEFAGLIESGDIYYDLAKLAGGLIINYALIKNSEFDMTINDDSVELSVPNISGIEQYQKVLYEYILNKNLDIKKVKLLVPIIFLNMSPLHTAPFDQFLWYLGLKLLNEELLQS